MHLALEYYQHFPWYVIEYGTQPSMAVRYGSPQFLLRITVRWYGTFFVVMVRVRYVGTVRLSCKGTGTVRWYAL